MVRILFILPGLVPPPTEAKHDQFHYLSEIAEGEILLPVWWSSMRDVSPAFRQSFPIHPVGKFRYHMFLGYQPPRLLRPLAKLFFFVRRGLQLHSQNKFDAIMVYGTNLPGIAGVILKILTGSKLITEVPGVPENAYRYDSPQRARIATVKRMAADALLLFVGSVSDCFKLLYPQHLSHYPALAKKRAAVFHAFVPISTICGREERQTSILLVGYPWYTKGVDVLIRAFSSIAPMFPNVKLRLMGHYPDRSLLDGMIGSCARVEFVKPGPYEAALYEIAGCSIYVLASRTESMGRVLLEAAAARKPIVAAAVNGVPYYITNNETGLLFQSEDSAGLASRLTELLQSEELRSRLATKAHQRVQTELSERSFVRAFEQMLNGMNLAHLS